MNIYLIAGLGADERIFKRLDLSPHNIHYIHWVAPQKGDDMKTYAERLAPQIDRSTDFALLGVSFGGMIATELHEQMDAKKLIIVSSVKNYNELPFIYRCIGKLNLHKLIPFPLLKKSSLNYFIFGCTTADSKKLLKNILNDTDNTFLRWAIDTIVRWKRVSNTKETVHIHGDKDYILKAKNIDKSMLIKGGGHFVIFNKAAQVSAQILKALEQ